MTTETCGAIFITLPAQQQFLKHRLSKNIVPKGHRQHEQDETALSQPLPDLSQVVDIRDGHRSAAGST
ncbi:hypothetical protein [Lacunimicrobium album]